jgi:hypothetical protein
MTFDSGQIWGPGAAYSKRVPRASVKCVLLAATEFIIPLCRTHFALSVHINTISNLRVGFIWICCCSRRNTVTRSVLSDFKWDKHRAIQLQVGALVKMRSISFVLSACCSIECKFCAPVRALGRNIMHR